VFGYIFSRPVVFALGSLRLLLHVSFGALIDKCHTGYQKANAVYDLVVGKAGGTVLLDAGVNETKANCIIVGAKGKPITAQDFAKVYLYV